MCRFNTIIYWKMFYGSTSNNICKRERLFWKIWKFTNKLFTKIANTADFVPEQGDIAVWGSKLGNTYGHVSIATGEGDTNKFYSYDLNWGSKVVKKVQHSYKGFLGVLRPKAKPKT